MILQACSDGKPRKDSVAEGEKALAVGVSVVLLSACVGTYVEPVGEDTATLRVENESFFVLRVQTVGNAEMCSEILNTHPGTGIPASSMYTVSIKSGDRFNFRLSGLSSDRATGFRDPRHTCTIAASFVPAAGSTYVARFEARARKCYFQLVEKFSGADGKPEYRRVQDLERLPDCEWGVSR